MRGGSDILHTIFFVSQFFAEEDIKPPRKQANIWTLISLFPQRDMLDIEFDKLH